MASSRSNNQVARVTEYYPYPSNLSAAASFMSVKLSGRDNYHMWKAQMRCLLESHDMQGFIDGDFPWFKAKRTGGEDYRLWTRSDTVVKGWILGSLTEETLRYVLYCIREEIHQKVVKPFKAKDVWLELFVIYGCDPAADLPIPERQTIEDAHESLYRATLHGDWGEVEKILIKGKVKVIDKIAINENTALHVAASNTKKPELLQKLLEKMPPNTDLERLRNSEGSTPLHVAAIVGNIEAAKILLKNNKDLLLATDNNNQTPLAIALSNTDTKMSESLLASNTDNENNILVAGRSGDELLAIFISTKEFRLAHDLVERYKTLNGDTVLMAIAQNFPRRTQYT